MSADSRAWIAFTFGLILGVFGTIGVVMLTGG